MRGILLIPIALLAACNPFVSDDDPWGCKDRKPFVFSNTVLPEARLNQAYSFDFSGIAGPNLKLVDTARASGYGLRLNGFRLEGTPRATTPLDSFRLVGWEYGTQCSGRSDTFTAYLTVRP